MANMATSTKSYAFAVLLAASLTACSGNKVKEKPACIFADGSDKAAPMWVCNDPIEDFALAGIGYADASIGGQDTSFRLAQGEALASLLGHVRTKLRAALDSYTQQHPIPALDIDALKRSVLNEVDRSAVDDAQVAASTSTPSDGMVVAMGLDTYDLESAGRQALQNSYIKQPELWQPWLAGQDFIQTQEDIIRLLSERDAQ